MICTEKTQPNKSESNCSKASVSFWISPLYSYFIVQVSFFLCDMSYVNAKIVKCMTNPVLIYSATKNSTKI